jgi:flagellar motor component MotA
LPTIKSRACVFSDNTVEDEILIEEIEALAKKVFDNLSTVNYVNLLVVINHIHEEQYRAFMLALERLWRKETERYNEYKLICKYIQDIRSSTNMTRHLRTLLQELKELRQ